MTEANQLPTHDQPDTETNEETLRQMTGAPDINQPLVEKDAFADIDTSSSRPVWKLPIPKLAFIGLALVPVFGLVGYFLVGSKPASQQATIPDSPEEFIETNEVEESSELQQAEQEISTLKAQIALDDQAYVKETQHSSSEPVAQSAQPSEPVITSAPRAQTVSVATRSTPPAISYSPPPLPIQPRTSNFNNFSTPVAASSNLDSVDPYEQWQQLAQLGSYGSISKPERQVETDSAVANAGNLRLLFGSFCHHFHCSSPNLYICRFS
ncbi:MAG: hypothetical protein WA949_10475 [Phormidesmis sp.]